MSEDFLLLNKTLHPHDLEQIIEWRDKNPTSTFKEAEKVFLMDVSKYQDQYWVELSYHTWSAKFLIHKSEYDLLRWCELTVPAFPQPQQQNENDKNCSFSLETEHKDNKPNPHIDIQWESLEDLVILDPYLIAAKVTIYGKGCLPPEALKKLNEIQTLQRKFLSTTYMDLTLSHLKQYKVVGTIDFSLVPMILSKKGN